MTTASSSRRSRCRRTWRSKGLTGSVVASMLLDRLTALQNKTDSSRAAGSYTRDWGNDIKVEIPNTGISISEAYRYLVGWLGNQTHISGEVYRTDNGIALNVRVSGNAGYHRSKATMPRSKRADGSRRRFRLSADAALSLWRHLSDLSQFAERRGRSRAA